MKKVYLLLTTLITFNFSSNLYAYDSDDEEIEIKNEDQKENIKAYTDPSFGHEPTIYPLINTLVDEGKALLTHLYKDQELFTPKLLEYINHGSVSATKYAPIREKLSIITGGYRYLKTIYYGENESEQKRKEYLTKIITMMWGIFGESVDKNDGFARGSFKIIDPDFKLYNFLLDYVKIATGCDNPHLLPYATTGSNLAYRRSPRLKGSSHYANECFNDEQFGIDVRRETYETSLKILPSSKTHILFGRLVIPGSDLPITFIKFEEVGMGGLGETFDHSVNFGASRHNSKEADRREKDIPSDIKEAFMSLHNAFSVSNSIICSIDEEKSENIVDNSFIEFELVKDPITEFEKVAVKGPIYKMINFLTKNFHELEHFDETMKAFYQVLEFFGYEKEFAHIRNGNEVILDHRFF